MKDFFNAKEQGMHLAVLACQGTARRFYTETNALTKEEEKYIKKAEEYLLKFTASVFERMGDPYKRKLLSTLDCNDLRLVGKYSAEREAISKCASEDLLPKVRQMQMLNCMDCEKQDHTGCAMYAMGVACGLEDTNEEGGCPFRM